MPVSETLLEESKDRLARMVALLGFEAEITAAEQDGVINLNLKTREAGRLIGRKGHCLQSLELLLDRMLRKQYETCPPLEVVIDGYRNTRDRSRRSERSDIDKERFEKMARDAAKEVTRWGEERTLGPLSAAERRVIHMTLRDDARVETVSADPDERGRKHVIVRLKSAADT